MWDYAGIFKTECVGPMTNFLFRRRATDLRCSI
jgi:hypothetical protein